MREVKFRCKVTTGDKPWHVFKFPVLGFGMSVKHYDLNTWTQFTGLKDKNGKDIYEGDYVVCPERRHLDEEGVVEMSHTGQYVLAQGSFKVSVHALLFNKWKLEVIGNIFDNPELLK